MAGSTHRTKAFNARFGILEKNLLLSFGSIMMCLHFLESTPFEFFKFRVTTLLRLFVNFCLLKDKFQQYKHRKSMLWIRYYSVSIFSLDDDVVYFIILSSAILKYGTVLCVCCFDVSMRKGKKESSI